ncbi:ornithine cyclodeaminase [Actinomyces vulturis]|uniref:ornithine cyclodeaminase n=1 Tax=Actinomyces vulturis TaxID=1857645 RepID=UPI00082ED94E|nr:ornithine cyclodeaminase [Actinomyces vulturis]
MKFVGVDSMLRWIATSGPDDVIAGMIQAMEGDFMRWTQFERRPRIASHSRDGVIELMPTSDGERYAFKYVNGHPSNPARGYQTVSAFGVLADVHNGYPRMLAEMTVLTALRTAAASGLAIKHLARPDSRVLGMIGAGSQAEFQALAAMAVRPIESIQVFDVDAAACAKMQRNMASMGMNISVCSSASEAVSGADIITTCTADKRNAQVIHSADITPGVHINGIGGDCPGKTEFDPTILDMGPVFVEHTAQTRIEGEIQAKPEDFPVTELWEVITGTAVGRTSPDQITIFDSVGFAIEDFTALNYLDQATEGTDLYEEIDLVAAPADPKDLFGMLAGPTEDARLGVPTASELASMMRADFPMPA